MSTNWSRVHYERSVAAIPDIEKDLEIAQQAVRRLQCAVRSRFGVIRKAELRMDRNWNEQLRQAERALFVLSGWHCQVKNEQAIVNELAEDLVQGRFR